MVLLVGSLSDGVVMVLLLLVGSGGVWRLWYFTDDGYNSNDHGESISN